MINFDRQKDKVAIIAPASGSDDAENRLKATIEIFESKGFNCIYDDKIFTKSGLEYFAAPRAERLRQLQWAIENPSVKIIAAFRGGYGCSEIVFDCLEIKPSSPKILIGFSDITVLHFLFNQHYKFPSIHGAVGESYKNTFKAMISVLEGDDICFDLEPLNNAVQDGSVLEGEMLGGNLTLICNMIGTALHPQLADKILFIEDVNEKGYHVHRHLMHMKNAKLLEAVKAVIFGDFTESDKYLLQSIESFVDEHLPTIPVYKTTGIGHGDKNYPVTIGGMAKITSNKLAVSSPFRLT